MRDGDGAGRFGLLGYPGSHEDPVVSGSFPFWEMAQPAYRAS